MAPIYLNLLVNFIIKEYFRDERCIFLLTDQEFGINTSETNIPIVILRNKNASFTFDVLFSYYGCQSIILHVENPPPLFADLEDQIRLHLDRFNKRRYLILPTKDEPENATHLFKMPLNYVADVLLVTYEYVSKGLPSCRDEYMFDWVIDEIYSFYTHQYIGRENCDRPLLIKKWNFNSSNLTDLKGLFPNKLDNQMGRKLRIATFTYLPYSIPINPPMASDGIEMRVALEFAKKLNMSVQLVVNEEEEWGDIYQNWTGTGIVGNLIFDRADIGFAALYTWEEHYHFLDLSKPLVRTGITCLAPAPRLSAGWFVPLLSFSPSTWIGVGISFIMSALILFTITMIEKSAPDGYSPSLLYTLELVFLKTIASFLLQSLPRRAVPTKRVMKYMMATIFLSSLLLTSCYNSGLASSMTIPRYDDPINTIDDLVAANIHWGATSTAWITSIENAEGEKFQKAVSQFVVASKEQLYGYAMGPTKFAFSIERLPFGHYAIGNYIRQNNVQKFRPMTTDIYWEQCVIMTRKSSILLPMLDMLILRIAESGLPAYWENEVSMLHSDAKVQEAVKYYAHHHDKEVIRLKMKHVEGAFGVLMIGSSAAIVCFIVELLTHKYCSHHIPFTL